MKKLAWEYNGLYKRENVKTVVFCTELKNFKTLYFYFNIDLLQILKTRNKRTKYAVTLFKTVKRQLNITKFQIDKTKIIKHQSIKIFKKV